MKNFKINIKRLFFSFAMIIIAIYSYVTVNPINENSVSTMSVPATNKVIIVDAGHGGEDGGAVSEDGISEADINIEIALKLQKLLEASGATVILTRSDENAIYSENAKSIREKKISDTKNRVKLANSSNADIFVSIHLNKINECQYCGWQTFYKNGNDNGKKLATAIQNNLNLAIQKENERVPLKINNVYIIKHIEIPTVIVECGFLSNEKEKKQLQEEEYQNKLTWGIYNGIMDYFL